MTKIYYEDPIKCVYMHFEFSLNTDQSQDGDGVYYVHSESEHIFQPLHGDKNIDGFVFDETRNGWVRGDEVHAPDELPIHMRDGKLFFMAEHEK